MPCVGGDKDERFSHRCSHAWKRSMVQTQRDIKGHTACLYTHEIQMKASVRTLAAGAMHSCTEGSLEFSRA